MAIGSIQNEQKPRYICSGTLIILEPQFINQLFKFSLHENISRLLTGGGVDVKVLEEDLRVSGGGSTTLVVADYEGKGKRLASGIPEAQHPAFLLGGNVFNQVGTKVVADYIMWPEKVVRPYIAAGAGMTIEKASTGSLGTSIYGTIDPRIGLQVWRFLLALEFDFAYNMQYGFLSTETATGLSLSCVF